MIIIEASNIYFGGGFVLLDQILRFCEKNELYAKVYIGYVDVYKELKNRKFEYAILEKTNSRNEMIHFDISDASFQI